MTINRGGPMGWAIRAAIWIALSFFIFIGLSQLTGCIGIVGDAGAGLGGSHQGSGQVISQVRQTGAFSEVKVSSSIRVRLSQGDERRVVVETDDNLMEDLQTKVSGGCLEIGFKSWGSYSPTVAVVTVVSPEIQEVTVRGSGRVIGQGLITARDMELEIYGTGRIDLDLKADSVDCEINGSGRMKLALDAARVEAQINGSGRMDMTGRSGLADLEINGSGDFNAPGLTLDRAGVEINGSGNVRLKVNDRLKIKVRGSGDVVYSGPARVESRIGGSGSVTRSD